MKYDFDFLPDRQHTESVKWGVFDKDVLPMWVADMDFRSPEPIIRALQERVSHGVFGYAMEMPETAGNYPEASGGKLSLECQS